MPLGESGFQTFLFHHFSYKAHTSPPVIAEIAKNILHGFPGGKWLLFLRLIAFLIKNILLYEDLDH